MTEREYPNLRDYFAMAVLGNPSVVFTGRDEWDHLLVQRCYRLADLMLKEREVK